MQGLILTIKMLPKRFGTEIEKKWQDKWEADGIYKFDVKSELPVYSIDTPPPFTSGSLHLGHVYNHAWIDFVARYKRMTGHSVLLPQGFDCHGLPTELAVEKKMKVKKQNRDEFLLACRDWTEKAITRMKSQFKSLGYSTDWEHSYRTMDDSYKLRVQKSLLDFYEKDLLFREKHPVLWCTKCGTALAKAEVGHIEGTGKLYHIDIAVEGGHKFTIGTSRPEMMPACVAVLVNPKDSRYKSFVGKEATMPIFGNRVPIIADEDVDMEFGTGVVYLCTFGDEQDIRWQKKYKLPVIIAITPYGKMTEACGMLAGMKLKDAREHVAEELEKLGCLRKVEEYQHNVLCHTERSSCNNPIELLPTEQWFIKIKDSLKDIEDAADTMDWRPEYMLGRLKDWTEAMDWDWIISRQRVFGTPIPFWVCDRCKKAIPATIDELPVDPRGTTKDCECGGVAHGEIDVCDCWVDSSMSPLTITKWHEDEEFFSKTYPASLRSQGYEIIRTWTFYTIFRNLILTGKPCFKELMINGMVGGPDGKKMSKSLGNVIEPETVLEKYSADAIRQWAASGSLGEDFQFSWDECEHSGRFLTKLWNVSRFISGHLEDFDPTADVPELRMTDKWILSRIEEVAREARRGFDNKTFNVPLQGIRTFIWHDLADYYLEMVKYRLYKPEEYGEESRRAAQYTLYVALEKSLRLLAPIAPHITEELYAELFGKYSIHQEKYPEVDESNIDDSAKAACEAMIDAIDYIRKYKSDNNLSLGAELDELEIEVKEPELLTPLIEDIKGTGRIKNLKIKKI